MYYLKQEQKLVADR